MILDEGRVLLARQADIKQWSLIGGGIELGEEPRDALIREVAEEIGCPPTGIQLFGASVPSQMRNPLRLIEGADPAAQEIARIGLRCVLQVGCGVVDEDGNVEAPRIVAVPLNKAVNAHYEIDQAMWM